MASSSLTLSFCDLVSFSLVPLQPSYFICGRDKMKVGLDVSDLAASGLNAFSGNLAVLNCSWVRVKNDIVWYEVDVIDGACGNTLRVITVFWCKPNYQHV